MPRLALLAGLAAAAPALAQFGFVPALPGAPAVRIATISTNGQYAVGSCDLAFPATGSLAFRWLVGSPEAQNLNLPPEYIHQEPNCVTATGSVVSGQARTVSQSRGFRWTAAGGFSTYGFLAGTNASEVYGISGTGQNATGISYSLSTGLGQPFRWTSGQVMQGLGNLPGGNLGVGLAISADGGTIVGSSGTVANQRSFRWTAGGGMQPLGELPGQSESAATAISPDGSTIAGRSGNIAFRWTLAGGLQSLGTLPGMAGHEPRALSTDGSIIVGIATNFDGANSGWVWTAATGIQHADVYLASRGVNVSGVQLEEVSGVSGDGRTFVGNSLLGGWYAQVGPGTPPPCYANCDSSTAAPLLNVLDFNCFLNRFSGGDTWANCDASTAAPVLNVLDFNCFLNRFTAGCP